MGRGWLVVGRRQSGKHAITFCDRQADYREADENGAVLEAGIGTSPSSRAFSASVCVAPVAKRVEAKSRVAVLRRQS